MSILELNNISYGYIDGGVKRMICDDISYTFERGKFYTILGASGSGKTTLLSIASALEKPQSGQVIYDGTDIKKMGLTNYRKDKVGIVFQSYNLIDYLTAHENVVSAMNITSNKINGDNKEIAYKLLDRLGIVATKANRLTSKLSGGEKQRVAIARALATNVDLIFADEPTGNLDAITETEIIDIFKMLAKEYNKCIIVVTHSLDVAAQSDVMIKFDGNTLTEVK